MNAQITFSSVSTEREKQIILCTSSVKLPLRWLRSFTPVTYLCTPQGIHSLAALLGLWPRPTGPAQALYKMLKRFVMQLE